ncbi:pyridoxal phosphate-dependent decarboxylase family protein [Psychroserpens sp.]|uniref:pyridoxal phosphate-dependent decarboxylase family protein n=1 Tax=Psychroserpens sp. TaxID=2020870 RepID=UPI001B268EF1|nr:aminotransferase class V-fold PLP-dependent enzyme [Psychroserpens sp.]MBO6607197.1 aminotransferase class V-fold PLP-dependent enzyme [Psychroserpens sp.]MBO6630777.1 aminotransferase class V-fold PLP-dependent enzyme [Psychroserpens sp.]MBO6654343.1 aminotransferase class V-fold PLP-dependent enzyme [Psychroserpens sp.]MBO6682371.1 aminotransferase class V-fold PLP-dependent enzyme [Psychroserpens sp.]MBO6750969.1 aminotransferase class V-fold PLP-dependent enzyme [Psychroserpens sp.]
MRDKIKALEKVSKQLDPNTEIRADWNRDVLNYADNFIEQLDSTKAYSVNESNGKGIYDQDITEHATDLKTLLKHTSKDIDAVGINPAAAGHMGYIPGGGLYPSALGDYIAAIHNRYAGVFYAAPGAVRLEDMLIRWMCKLMGYPNQAVGHLTSGGSIANLVAIVTARESQGLKANNIPKAVIYLSEQAHHSIQKALRIAGLSEAQLRYIPLDEGLRLSISHLERAIIDDKANGLKPFFINASLGTTNTGAIDPIENIGEIAKKHHIWFHVDAAYGGFFRLVEKLAPKFKGVSQADSITLDPHKTLFLPFGTGAVLLKEKTHVLKVFYYLADYMQDTADANEILSPADISPELTKHFRGMRLWLPLKLFGLKPFRAALEEKLLLARYFHKEIQKIAGFEVGPEPELSVAMFRYRTQKGDLNEFNTKLIKAIQHDGRIFLSSTTINGVFWIRVAVVIFRTHLKQIDLLLEIIKEKINELET